MRNTKKNATGNTENYYFKYNRRLNKDAIFDLLIKRWFLISFG